MNENIDLREILKDVPAGTKLYSPLYGEVKFHSIEGVINVITSDDYLVRFGYSGRYFTEYNDSECLLFPSRDQRDWSKFQAPNSPECKKIQVHLMPFDRVLGRDDEEEDWNIDLYQMYVCDIQYPHICLHSVYKQVVPYNEDTRPLIDTANTPTIDYEIIPWNKNE